ncbi:MAG: hypothetical protein G01um101449_273 [Parcubacteria group bacterium Gr01-1014_49]|nr:MAG: hypothetical protein G01um101449_273 [Parcubacteria group bacterium Gr01-1014_49]
MYTPRAFTLIEVLITTALFAVLIGAITQLYVVFGRMVSLKQSTIGATLSVSAITDAVRGAGLEAGGVASTHVFSSTSYSSGTTTVIFELPAVDASGAPIVNTYDYVGVHATGTSVYRFIDAAPGSFRTSGTKQLTNVLDELRFTYDQPDFASVTSVTVDATTSAVAAGETMFRHLRERVYLRNL